MTRVDGLVRVVARACLGVLAAAFAAGCGGGTGSPSAGTAGDPGKANPDTLSGVVRVGDKPLTHGTVAFHTAGGKVLKAFIVIDGTYSLSTKGATPGPAKVVVVSGEPPKMPSAGGAPPADAPKMVRTDFAAKYGDVATTDLVYDIQPGKHKYEIVLTP